MSGRGGVPPIVVEAVQAHGRCLGDKLKDRKRELASLRMQAGVLEQSVSNLRKEMALLAGFLDKHSPVAHREGWVAELESEGDVPGGA